MTYISELTELVTAIFMGILFSIFISAFFILVLILKKKTHIGTSYSLKNNISQITSNRRSFSHNPEIKLLKPVSSNIMDDGSDTSLGEGIVDYPNVFNTIMNNDARWAERASVLISHCMAVLMNCRLLTENLTSVAISSLDEWDPQMAHLVDIAKLITLRVDQFVTSMRSPLNPSVLEARAASLTLAVTHLAIMTQFECTNSKLPAEWVSNLLNNIQKHIDLLNCETGNMCSSRPSIELLNTSISIQ